MDSANADNLMNSGKERKDRRISAKADAIQSSRYVEVDGLPIVCKENKDKFLGSRPCFFKKTLPKEKKENGPRTPKDIGNIFIKFCRENKDDYPLAIPKQDFIDYVLRTFEGVDAQSIQSMLDALEQEGFFVSPLYEKGFLQKAKKSKAAGIHSTKGVVSLPSKRYAAYEIIVELDRINPGKATRKQFQAEMVERTYSESSHSEYIRYLLNEGAIIILGVHGEGLIAPNPLVVVEEQKKRRYKRLAR